MTNTNYKKWLISLVDCKINIPKIVFEFKLVNFDFCNNYWLQDEQLLPSLFLEAISRCVPNCFFFFINWFTPKILISLPSTEATAERNFYGWNMDENTRETIKRIDMIICLSPYVIINHDEVADTCICSVEQNTGIVIWLITTKCFSGFLI